MGAIWWQICIHVVPESKLKPSYTGSLRGKLQNWTFLNEMLACAEVQTLPSYCMPITIYRLQQASLQSWYSTFYSQFPNMVSLVFLVCFLFVLFFFFQMVRPRLSLVGERLSTHNSMRTLPPGCLGGFLELGRDEMQDAVSSLRVGGRFRLSIN